YFNKSQRIEIVSKIRFHLLLTINSNFTIMLKRKTAAEYFERNLELCCDTTRNTSLSTFLSSSSNLLSVYENYRRAFGYNSLAFFLSSIVGFGHFGGYSLTYSRKTNSYKPITSKKSRYIQKVYDATTTAEKILIKQKSVEEQLDLACFAMKSQNTKATEHLPIPLPDEILHRITFIEQTLSYPEAIRSLTKSNVFICAPEGDYILDQVKFFELGAQENIEMKGCVSALFDGQRITRSNFHGRMIIEKKTISICVGSTGARWLNILLHLHENLTTDGFHPRFLLHSLEPATTNDGNEDLLDRKQPSLIHLYIIRGLMGNRIQVFSPDASDFIEPYLTALDSNQQHPDIKYRGVSSYEQVVERRGAELIIRLAANIQYQKDILTVISHLESIDFYDYGQLFIDQTKEIIESLFGPAVNPKDEYTTTLLRNKSRMIISKETCEEALNLFINILMPQHLILMNHQISINSNETPSELKLQTEILNLKYVFFYKTTLCGNQGILKNIKKEKVDHLLNRLVHRGILKKGKYIKSTNLNVIHDSYLKFLPLDQFEEEDLKLELIKHNLKLETYQTIYKNSLIAPNGTSITDAGNIELQQQNLSFMINNEQQPRLISTNSNSIIVENNQYMNINVDNNSFENEHDVLSMCANGQQVDQLINKSHSVINNIDNATRSQIFTIEQQTQPLLLSTDNSKNSSTSQQESIQININSPSSSSDSQEHQQQHNQNQNQQQYQREHEYDQQQQHQLNQNANQQYQLNQNFDPQQYQLNQNSDQQQQLNQNSDQQQQLNQNFDPQQHQLNQHTNQQYQLNQNSDPQQYQLNQNSDQQQQLNQNSDQQQQLNQNFDPQQHQLNQHTNQQYQLNQNFDQQHQGDLVSDFTNTGCAMESNSFTSNKETEPASNNIQVQQRKQNIHTKAQFTYRQFAASVSNTSTPIDAFENNTINSLSLSTSSNIEKNNWSIDPIQALANPRLIPLRLLSKCKSMLLSSFPILTKTCWNRRFGGNVGLCTAATQLLVCADLLKEGSFGARLSNSFVCWIKKLPLDSKNTTETLEFQQHKLNIFNTTWTEYVLSFKTNSITHANKTIFITPEAGEILRSETYRNVGFILDESIVSTRKVKDSSPNPASQTASFIATSTPHEHSSSIDLHVSSLATNT
ncbi:unnamed protein product, partial [Adineta steineri]